MKIEKITANNINFAIVNSREICISDAQTALDFMASMSYHTDCHHIILNKEALIEEFFDLKTRIAGEILQKFVNYNMKVSIVGDFSGYKSKSLNDFIYECNKGKDIFFQPSIEAALEKATAKGHSHHLTRP